jgi:aspartate/methionine/tyrosine aminotransferase
MYLWLRLPEDVPSGLFAERLLEDEGVVIMPGSAFGAGGEGFFRVSFITAPHRIAEAARRAGRVLANLMAEVA